MKRGDIYGTANQLGHDPRQQRYFVVVSRRALIDSRFATVICAPIYSVHDGLSTQVAVGISEGLPGDGCIHADALISLPKTILTHYVGALSPAKLRTLNKALVLALELEA